MTTESRPPKAGRPSPTDGRPPSDHSTELVSLIRREIETGPDRRITFARYMELALYEPSLGYYRQAADRPTDAGDFLTAPETHPMFGWTIAGRIEEMWSDLGRPGPFDMVEYGAGSGTLGLSILDGLRRHGASDLLAAPIRYEAVESNPNRMADLRMRFQEAGMVDRLVERKVSIEPTASSGLPPTSSSDGGAKQAASEGFVPVTGVILANEFLDALPVHRVVVRGGELFELFVVWREATGGAFAEWAAEPSTPELARRLVDDGVKLAEGQVAEICLGLGEWLRGVAARLERGFVIAIDYGYEAAELYGPRRLAGTLLGYRGHRVVESPFTAPGQVDLTAHVDFTAVQREAAALGFRTVSMTTQSEFLVAAGLEDEWRALQSSPDLALADYTRARSAVVRLLDPRHLGRFRVLILARDS